MPSDPVLGVFARSPDGSRGLARDMPVRRALEEVGRPYAVRPLTVAEMDAPAHRARQPFRQIPTCEAAGRTLFESGAIVLSVARRHPGLQPADEAAADRALAWMFAAKTTVEPPITEHERAGYLERDRPWFAARQALLDDRIRTRLDDLAAHLGAADWLAGAFTAGDLMMVTVLRRRAGTGLPDPTLAAYVARAEARPAFARAFAAQRATFEAGAARHAG